MPGSLSERVLHRLYDARKFRRFIRSRSCPSLREVADLQTDRAPLYGPAPCETFSDCRRVS
jgi:hypothetical protein